VGMFLVMMVETWAYMSSFTTLLIISSIKSMIDL
jgi:hypothetical protein